MAMKSEVYKKCPKCGNHEEVKIDELTGYADNEDLYDPDTAENRYKSYRASCPCCGFSMRRRTVQELCRAWNVSKEKRVSHVKSCILGMPSVIYQGGCAYIGKDAVEEWRDEDGGFEKLKKHLKHKVGQEVYLTCPADGVGLIAYCDSKHDFNKVNDFIANLQG